jgi:hypothetical protein
VPAIAFGVDCADGNVGAVRAMADDSAAAVGVSFFHQAMRGQDWHPVLNVVTKPTTASRTTTRLMTCFLNGNGRLSLDFSWSSVADLLATWMNREGWFYLCWAVLDNSSASAGELDDRNASDYPVSVKVSD